MLYHDDPLYRLIDWLWSTTPYFKELHDDTKAIVSYLLFQLIFCSTTILAMWWWVGIL